MVPFVQSSLRDSLKTLFGMPSMNALAALVLCDEALMRLAGYKAHQLRHGVCQRGAAPRQGPRTRGPLCPDALAPSLRIAHTYKPYFLHYNRWVGRIS
jgi:hypothetical protein